MAIYGALGENPSLAGSRRGEYVDRGTLVIAVGSNGVGTVTVPAPMRSIKHFLLTVDDLGVVGRRRDRHQTRRCYRQLERRGDNPDDQPLCRDIQLQPNPPSNRCRRLRPLGHLGYPLNISEITLPSAGQAPVPKNENYKVDVDRGVHIRFTRGGGEFPEGMAVYMYLDKPGVFYNDHAKQVPPALAAAANYDIEPLLRARKKHEAMAKARQEVEAQFREDSGIREVIREEDDYLLIHIGSERYNVEFADGSPLTPQPMTKEVAERTFRAMLGDEELAKPTKK